MNSLSIESIVLYFLKSVILILKDGTKVRGVLQKYDAATLQIDETVYQIEDAADLFYFGKQITIRPNGKSGMVDDTYYFVAEDWQDKTMLETLRYGEYVCEVKCHLVLDNSIVARDISVLRMGCAYSEELLLKRPYLFLFEDNIYRRGQYKKTEEGSVLCIGEETIPFDPWAIKEITKAPQINNYVILAMKNGMHYSGVVCAATQAFFVLADPTIPHLCVEDIETVRYSGYVTAHGTMANNRYLLTGQTNAFPDGYKVSYTVHMNEERLLAKDVRLMDENSLVERVGIISSYERKKGGEGYITDRFVFGEQPEGQVIFNNDLLQFVYNQQEEVCVVRYYISEQESVLPGRMQHAIRIELIEKYTMAEYNEIMIGPDGSVKTVPYDAVFFGQEYLMKKRVEVTVEGSVITGYLTSITEDTLFLSKDVSGQDLLPIEKKLVTKIRGFGKITAYHAYNSQHNTGGFGYIDGDIFFHVTEFETAPGLSNHAIEGSSVSFKLNRAVKGNGIAAVEISFEDRQSTVAYVIGKTDGLYQVISQKDYETSRKQELITLLPLEGRTAPSNLEQYDYKMTVYLDENGVMESIGDLIAKQPKLYFGYTLKYFPDKRHGYLINEEKYQVETTGIMFTLGDVLNPPELFDTFRNTYYLSYKLVDNKVQQIKVLDTIANTSIATNSTNMSAKGLKSALEDSLTNNPNPLNALNDGITLCLKENQLTIAEEFLNKHESLLDREAYLTALCRILDKKYKNTQKPEEISIHSACIKELLALTSKTAFKMTLLLRMGELYLRLNNYEQAESYYLQWQDLCKELLELSPDKANNYKPWQKQVEYKLAICRGKGTITKPVADSQDITGEEEAELEGDFVYTHDYVSRVLNEIEIVSVLGEEFKPFIVIDAKNEEKLDELRELLEHIAPSETAEKNWALAKIYQDALLHHYTIFEDDENRRNLHIYNALLSEARSAMSLQSKGSKEASKLKGQFLSALALELVPDSKEAIDIYFAKTLLTDSMLKEFFDGEKNIDLSQLLSLRYKNGLEIMALDSIIIASQNDKTKDMIVQMLSAAGEEVCLQYIKALNGLLQRTTETETVGDVVLNQYINDAVQRYHEVKNLLISINEKQLGEMAAQKISEFRDKKNARWLEPERSKLSSLYVILEKLQRYNVQKGFRSKSELLESSIVLVGELKNTIERMPSYVASVIFVPFLQELFLKLKETYKVLCKTTKPELSLLPEESVIYKRARGQLHVEIPVQGSKNLSQSPQNIRLVIANSPDFVLLRNGVPVSNGIIGMKHLSSDGSKKHFSFDIQFTNPDCEYVTLHTKLSYAYIAQVKTTKQRDNGYKKIMEEIVKEYHVDIIPQEINRQPINTSYIGYFKHTVHYNDMVKDILKNRDDSIQEIIRHLTQENENGERILCEQPEWVALYGQWRVGKTTILETVRSYLQETYPQIIVVKLECPTVDTNQVEQTYKEEFAQTILNALRVAIRNKEEAVIELFNEVCCEIWDVAKKTKKSTDTKLKTVRVPSEKLDLDSLQEFLSEYTERLLQQTEGTRIILQIDEFTRLYQAILYGRVGSGFLEGWEKYFEGCGVSVITAGGEFTVGMLTKYIPNAMQKITMIAVENLSKEHTKQYIQFVVHDDEYLKYSADMVFEQIYRLTKGNTYLLYKFCNAMIEYVNDEEIPYITGTVLAKTVDRLAGNLSDDDATETELFNSLYNPFNESEEEDEAAIEISEGQRLEDDRVVYENRRIMRALVKWANPETHFCAESDLIKHLYDIEQDILDRRLNTLINRGVIEREGEALHITTELYYEIVSRRQDL